MYRPKNIAHSANTENCRTPRYNSPLRDVKTNLLQAVHGATLSLIAGEEVTPNAQRTRERRRRELGR